jgi:hypothetical protein
MATIAVTPVSVSFEFFKYDAAKRFASQQLQPSRVELIDRVLVARSNHRIAGQNCSGPSHVLGPHRPAAYRHSKLPSTARPGFTGLLGHLFISEY